MSPLVLGLDGGGTQTRVVVETRDGSVSGTGQGGACNIAAVSVSEALASALTAARAALQSAGAEQDDVCAICAGVAGTSYAHRREEFQQGLQTHFPQAQIVVVPDFAVALTGAINAQPGVIVIAGTGSVAYGENGRGGAHRTGGYGYLIDDGGSGYGVGRAALAAALRAADGTGAPTALTDNLLTALRMKNIMEIVPGIYGAGIDRVTIASLSRIVADTALGGDETARAILMRAGGALAQLVHGVTTALFDPESLPFPVVPIGGLWKAGGVLTDVFARSLARFAPQGVLTEPQHPPVQGAVLRARTLAGWSN